MQAACQKRDSFEEFSGDFWKDLWDYKEVEDFSVGFMENYCVGFNCVV